MSVQVVRERTPWIFLVVALGWFLVLGVRTVFPVLLPQIKAELGMNNTLAGLAMSVIWLVYATTQFPAGLLADRVGERAILSLAMAIAGVSVVLVAVSQTVVPFLLACGVFGASIGLYSPPAFTVLARLYPSNENLAIGGSLAAGNLGAAVLPVAATAVATSADWRVAVGVSAPLFLVAAPGLRVSLPGARDGESGPGAAVSIRARLRYLFSDRTTLLAAAGITVVSFTFQGMSTFLPEYLVTTKDVDQTLAATLFGAYFAIGALTKPVVGYVADRVSQRRTLVLLCLSYGCSLLALPFAQGLWELAGIVVVLGVSGALAPVNSAYIVSALPDDIEGGTLGLIRTLSVGIGAASPVLVGVLADAGRFDAGYAGLGLLAVAGTGLYFALPRRVAPGD